MCIIYLHFQQVLCVSVGNQSNRKKTSQNFKKSCLGTSWHTMCTSLHHYNQIVCVDSLFSSRRWIVGLSYIEGDESLHTHTHLFLLHAHTKKKKTPKKKKNTSYFKFLSTLACRIDGLAAVILFSTDPLLCQTPHHLFSTFLRSVFIPTSSFIATMFPFFWGLKNQFWMNFQTSPFNQTSIPNLYIT